MCPAVRRLRSGRGTRSRTRAVAAEQAMQNLERRELERLTREAVDTLDMLTREIFLRYYYRREKTAQIAQALGPNLSTVKTRLARRHENKKLLRAGKHPKGPAKRTREQEKLFVRALEQILHQ